MQRRSFSATVRAWARLTRLPNLFTVPGDPLVGYFLTWLMAGRPDIGWTGVGAGVVASIFLYLAGLLLNDYFDREEDLAERPERPLPSGEVRPGTALLAGLLCLAIAVAIVGLGAGRASAAVAGSLAVMVLAYDTGGKRVRFLGPALMASCRGASVLLGAAVFLDSSRVAGGHLPLALAAAGATWLYIFAITVIAATETKGKTPPGVLPYLPAFLLGLGIGVGLMAVGAAPPIVPLTIFVFVTLEALFDGWRVASGSLPVPPYIGSLLRKLVFIQGAWLCWAASEEPVGVMVRVLACILLARVGAELASRKFYGS